MSRSWEIAQKIEFPFITILTKKQNVKMKRGNEFLKLEFHTHQLIQNIYSLKVKITYFNVLNSLGCQEPGTIVSAN